jgi:hypothetical protein
VRARAPSAHSCLSVSTRSIEQANQNAKLLRKSEFKSPDAGEVVPEGRRLRGFFFRLQADACSRPFKAIKNLCITC